MMARGAAASSRAGRYLNILHDARVWHNQIERAQVVLLDIDMPGRSGVLGGTGVAARAGLIARAKKKSALLVVGAGTLVTLEDGAQGGGRLRRAHRPGSVVKRAMADARESA